MQEDQGTLSTRDSHKQIEFDHEPIQMDQHVEQNSAAESWAAITPMELIGTVFRRLPSVLITSIIVALLVGLAVVAWPNRYNSDGLMYVRLGRAALSADPTAQNSNAVSLQESRTSGVITIGDMIGSREIAERAVNQVGVNRINEPRSWIDRLAKWGASFAPKGSQSTEMSREEYDLQIAREEAVKRVRSWVGISVPKDGYTVSVNGRATDPVLIQEIVQAMMVEYKSYHVEAHSANGSLEFFEQQVADSRDAAMSANRALQTTKNELGWMSAESAEETLRERIVQLEIAHDQAAGSLAEAESNNKELERRLITMEEWVPTEITKGIEKKSGEDMRTQLYELQVEQTEALAKFKPNHPRYKLMKKKLEDSQTILDSAEKNGEQTMEALNPVRVAMEGEHQLAAAKVAGLRSKQASLAKTLAKAKEELQRLNRDAITLSKLKWERDIAEKNFLGHAKSLEEARVASELDSQKLSDVSIIQDASLNLKRAGPSKALLILAGMFVGVLLGMLQAILRDKPTTTQARASAEPRERTTIRESNQEREGFLVG